jgi:hypothetical protein
MSLAQSSKPLSFLFLFSNLKQFNLDIVISGSLISYKSKEANNELT